MKQTCSWNHLLIEFSASTKTGTAKPDVPIDFAIREAFNPLLLSRQRMRMCVAILLLACGEVAQAGVGFVSSLNRAASLQFSTA